MHFLFFGGENLDYNGKKKPEPAIILHEQKTVEVLEYLASEWKSPKGYFQNVVPPERRFLPDGIKIGSRDHARFLFFAGWMSRSGQQANQAISISKKIFDQYPHLIDPNVERSHPDFNLILYPLLPFDDKERSKRLNGWIECLSILRDKYLGDPRSICFELKTNDPLTAREQIIERMTEFPGIGHKIGQLIGGWFQEVDWKGEGDKKFWQNFRRIPMVAVDIWWLRLIKQLDLVSYYRSDHRDMISRPVSDQISWFCFKHDIPHMSAAQAMWWTGAGICNSLKNKSGSKANFHCHYCCPLDQFCVKVVIHNKEMKGRGLVGYDEAIPRVSLFSNPFVLSEFVTRMSSLKQNKVVQETTQIELF